MSWYVAAYLAAIAGANLLAATYGPAITPFTAFLLIGLDLALRDRLHDEWAHRHLILKMGALIAAGGALAWVVQPDAGRIALASVVAFTLAATADGITYHLIRDRPWMVRANGSNVAGALVDSVVFPTLAFGAFLPLVILGQFIAKVGGGLMWSWLIERWRRRAATHR